MASFVLELTHDAVLGFMREYTSADKAWRAAVEEGYEITRSAFRETWRTVGQADFWRTAYETYGTDRTIPKAWVLEQVSEKRTGYMVKVECQRYFPETGETKTAHYSKNFSTFRDADTAIDVLRPIVDEYADEEGAVVLSVRFAGVFRLVRKK